MWFGGIAAVHAVSALVPHSSLVLKVGVVTWQVPQSPVAGWLASSVELGRESPAAVPLATMPAEAAAS